MEKEKVIGPSNVGSDRIIAKCKYNKQLLNYKSNFERGNYDKHKHIAPRVLCIVTKNKQTNNKINYDYTVK